MNWQRFVLYDESNVELGSAEIKYIDKLTGNKEKDIIYLVWIYNYTRMDLLKKV